MEGFGRRLREIGVRMAVDDLGSGTASLSHMARLAPDFIKVDRSLVHDVHLHPYQAALLNALALFADRMGAGYIVEGIETLEELQAVIDADVPWGQGFIFGQPEPLRLMLAAEP
jgi:EAL domain-containing protein (putative c-di-GMP-specific phosphodiesterase class I)